jgi:hypothetical protein
VVVVPVAVVLLVVPVALVAAVAVALLVAVVVNPITEKKVSGSIQIPFYKKEIIIFQC